MKKLYYILIFLALGCYHKEVRIRPEKRITVSGNVLGTGETPLHDIPVLSYGSFRYHYVPYQDNSLGLGLTDTSGNFKFVSLDSNNSDFTVAINSNKSSLYKSDYITLYFQDTIDRHGVQLNFPDVILKKQFPVTLNLVNSQSSENVITYKVYLPSTQKYYLIESGEIGDEVTEEVSVSGNLDEATPEREISFQGVENSGFSIRYQVNGGTVQDTTFILSESNTFRFEF